MLESPQRVMVTGASGFLGFRVAAALLEVGATVTVLVRPEQEDKLASLANRVRIQHADIWNRPSLKGLARGHDAIVHLVGSRQIDPARGLTYQQVNLVSARNVIGMAVSDGILNFGLISVAALPGMHPPEYMRSKRDAEEYLRNSGLQWTVYRVPALFVPSVKRPILSMLGWLGIIPPTRWLIGKYMPMGVDTAARGIAASVMQPRGVGVLYTNDLRRMARAYSGRPLLIRQARVERTLDELDETPFGWLPPPPKSRRKR